MPEVTHFLRMVFSERRGKFSRLQNRRRVALETTLFPLIRLLFVVNVVDIRILRCALRINACPPQRENDIMTRWMADWFPRVYIVRCDTLVRSEMIARDYRALVSRNPRLYDSRHVARQLLHDISFVKLVCLFSFRLER